MAALDRAVRSLPENEDAHTNVSPSRLNEELRGDCRDDRSDRAKNLFVKV